MVNLLLLLVFGLCGTIKSSIIRAERELIPEETVLSKIRSIILA